MVENRTELLGVLVDGRYRVESFLARGGTSTVFRGTDTRLDRPVAIKVMDARFAGDPEFLARFEREARSVARLSHPGLVAVHDQGSDRRDGQGTPFLVMDLVEGGTLRELLRERGRTGVPMALSVLEPVLAALAVAHRAGLVHRDVKPENVLVSTEGAVKVADFGLVRAVAAAGATSSGMILGTAAYLSPEQVSTGEADPRSDVYSVGVLAFELLTGAPPYGGDTPLAVAYQHVHHDVPAPGSLAHGVPPVLDDLVRRATDRDPEARFADAGQMHAAVLALREELGVAAVRVPSPRRHPVPAGSHPAPTAATTRVPAGPRGMTMVEERPGGTSVLRPPPSGPPSEHDTAAGPPGGADWTASRRRGRRTALVWVVVVALLAALVGAGAWVVGTVTVTAVPTVAGLDRDTASQVLADASLTPVVTSGYDDTVPVGVALGTDPAAGSELDRGTRVGLRISAGRPSVPAVPPGTPYAAAEQQLREATLVPVAGRDAFSETVAEGTVLSLDPDPGTEVAVGSEVAVARSLGSRPVTVPGVVNRSADDATRTLTRAGLVVTGTDEVFDAEVDGGDAVGTDPAAGSEVATGTSVRLQVSTAVTVPNVRGQTVRRARDRLESLGLQVTVAQLLETDAGLVVGQDPPNGRVAAGSTVALTALP